MSTSDELDRSAPDAPDAAHVDDDTVVGTPTPPSAVPVAASAPTVPAASPAVGPAAPVRPADDDAAARHAVQRPAPVPPAPAGSAARVPSRETPPPAGGARATAPGATAPAPGAAAAPIVPGAPLVGEPAGRPAPGPVRTPVRPESDEALFPDPNAPRTISVGTHLLGVVVGIVLPPLSAAVALLGNSRILAVEADGWVAQVEGLGIVLVTLGVLLLAACALLSLWTPTVGLVGGTVLTLAGALALYAPGIVRQGALDLFGSQEWEPTVLQTVVSATSGVLLIAGALVLTSGIASAVAHRHGIRLGAFRERHRV